MHFSLNALLKELLMHEKYQCCKSIVVTGGLGAEKAEEKKVLPAVGT